MYKISDRFEANLLIVNYEKLMFYSIGIMCEN